MERALGGRWLHFFYSASRSWRKRVGQTDRQTDRIPQILTRLVKIKEIRKNEKNTPQIEYPRNNYSFSDSTQCEERADVV
jgi:hypothetical protein